MAPKESLLLLTVKIPLSSDLEARGDSVASGQTKPKVVTLPAYPTPTLFNYSFRERELTFSKLITSTIPYLREKPLPLSEARQCSLFVASGGALAITSAACPTRANWKTIP